MKVKLTDQDIIKALTVYMGLRGFKAGDKFEFKASRNLTSVEFDVVPYEYDIGDIKKYANKE
ncbi:hypothetical protein PQE70_gp081 [Bacillus phage vB_BanS_Nate]|uniref:Uncharacterized protein n=1 Tax=Bacillus phage vB_BanS_Nate TaxID=2894788 RepID=A0AAE9CE67_9CAUD|nr:hypothetical protein PQE70_gp081 [Bacillus phage vB_BanS_Nate]UGO50934.1 hypothetical protein NATE_81 [Bacillus phage vB_BanS_Nate]